VDSTIIADAIIRSLLTRAGISVGRRFVDRFLGTARQREFEQALRSAVTRLAVRYPAIGSSSADTEFFGRAEVVDRLFQLVVLGVDDEALGISQALDATYDADALMHGVPSNRVIAELAGLLQDELVQLGTFADQLTYRGTREILRRLEGLRPVEPEAVRALRDLREQILASPLGRSIDPELRQREHEASLVMLPRPGHSVRVEANLRFAFPHTPQGRAAQAALDRSITAGHPLSLAGSYVELARITLNGEPLPGWGGERPRQVTLETVARPAPSRFTVFRDRVELASIDVLSLRLVRSGTDEDYFEASPDAPLHATVTVRRDGARMDMTVQFSTESRFRDAVEQWRVLRFLSCLAHADRCTWEILGTEVRQSGAVRAGVSPVTGDELAFAKALALVQEASGSPLPPLLPRDRRGLRHLLALARVVRRGYAIGTLASARARFPEEVAARFRALAASGATFSFATLQRQRTATFLGATVEFGPVLQYMASVRVIELVPGSFSLLPAGSTRALEIFYRWTEFAMPSDDDFGQFAIGAPNAPPLRFLRPKPS
jgi:hypothetical protein